MSTGLEPPQVGQVSEGHKNHDDSDDDFDSCKDNDNGYGNGKRILIKARPINGFFSSDKHEVLKAVSDQNFFKGCELGKSS